MNELKNGLQIFMFETNEVRTIKIDNEVFFVAKDVAKVLGYKDTSSAISDHCKGAVKRLPLQTNGGLQEVIMINRPNLYRLIVSSKLPLAEKFEKWVFEDVLPTIIETGSYSISYPTQLDLPKTYAEALRELANSVEKQEVLALENSEMKPKAEFFDQVTGSKDAIEMKDVAKALNFECVGRNKLFEVLRDEKVLMDNNTPYQKFIDDGLFRVIEQKWNKDGEVRINLKTVVYQKGVDFIRKILVQKGF